MTEKRNKKLIQRKPVLTIVKGNIVRHEDTQRSMLQRLRGIPKRYFVLALMFVACTLEAYTLSLMHTVISSIIPGGIVIHKNDSNGSAANTNETNGNVVSNNTIENLKSAYDWTPMEMNLVLYIVEAGHILACFSGIFVHRIGGASYLGVGKLGEAIITFTSPFVMDINVDLFIGQRFALGVFEGLSRIGSIDVMARWVPPKQRVRSTCVAVLGYFLGTATSRSLSKFVIRHFSWRLLFYLFGSTIFIWSILWIIFVRSNPAKDRFISDREKLYLSKVIDYFPEKKTAVPYKSVFTSIPVGVCLIELLISGFTYSFIFTLLPKYIEDIYPVKIQELGLLSRTPEISACLVRPILAFFVDFFRNQPNGFGITNVHKGLIISGHTLMMVSFFTATVANRLSVSMFCINLARNFFGLSMTSHEVITIDIAGQYSGFIGSLAYGITSVTNFLNPVVVGMLVTNHSPLEWNIYFILLGCGSVFSMIMFFFYGSGDLQSWAKPPAKPVEEMKEINIKLLIQ